MLGSRIVKPGTLEYAAQLAVQRKTGREVIKLGPVILNLAAKCVLFLFSGHYPPVGLKNGSISC